MLRFYYNPAYKYTNRTIIDISSDTNYIEKKYENIDSPDTINGHIIYQLEAAERIPTYVYDTESDHRWFVSGITQLRTGKYQISLLRDIISEDPNTWKNERAYISAGVANNYNKYKRWDLPYTNTKINQQRLPINGKPSFFVFYVNEQHWTGNVVSESDLEIEYTSIPGITGFDYTVSSLSDIPSYEYVGAGDVVNWYRHRAVANLAFDYLGSPIRYSMVEYQYDSGGSSYTQVMQYNYYNSMHLPYYVGHFQDNDYGCRNNVNTAIANFTSSYESSLGFTTISNSAISDLSDYVGKIIYNTGDNKVYRINATTETIPYDKLLTKAECSTLETALRNINFGPLAHNDPVEANGSWVVFKSECTKYNYTLEELGVATTFSFNFKADTRKLPKSAVRCVNIVSDSTYSDSDIAQMLMLAQTNGYMDGEQDTATTGRILDIQYLPFSVASSTSTDFVVNTTDYLTAEFLSADDYTYFTNLTDLTNINKETDTIKIVSPSRASQYLFRPYDNDGNMEFTTKITLKPYTSTIYVRPSTKGLLQRDWDDKDCLIIQEDFSLTNVSSQWTNYIYQNRTYLNAFERQMQGREYERSWERRIEQENMKSDEWNARAISAQKASTYTGNLPVISGIASAIGTAWADERYMAAAALDREYNEALYQEGMSMSRDLFNYQLENIKSQPLIPSKVTTIDCKFLDGVYLEFYSTNQTELNAIASYYTHNGNRIDDYGTFKDYWGPFVRGKIIISLNYTQPEIDELNRRLSMGIYTGGIL